MASKLQEKRDELKAKSDVLAKMFEQAGQEMDLSKVEALKDLATTTAKAGKIRELNDELTVLGQEVEALAAVEKAQQNVSDIQDKTKAPAGGMTHPGAGASPETQQKSLGQLFVESKAFTEKRGPSGPVAELDVDLKVLFQTPAGWAPETTRTGRVVLSAQAQPMVMDLIPKNTTSQAAVVYMAETVFIDAAAETAENGPYGEAGLQLAEQTAPVRKFTVWIPVTDEQLEDVAYVSGYIENRLTLMLNRRADTQVLVGNGLAPNITGINAHAQIQVQPLGADPVPDCIYKAMTLVRTVGQAEPTAVVLHPNDWQDIRLLRTVDGVYIWGSPADAGPERIWGKPVVQSTAQPQNTGLVGDFADYCEFVLRRGIEFQVTNSHANDFINGRQAVRADFRAAFPIYRGQAFCQAAGI